MHSMQALRSIQRPRSTISPMSSATGMISTGNRAAHRMIPSQQRFASRNPSRLEIDERLVEQLEFFIGQGLAQVQLQNAARLDGLGHLFAEETEGAAAVRLGSIVRHVCIIQ